MKARLQDLVGNPKAYAVQNKDGSWTPVRRPLTANVLNKHRNRSMTVGTYVLDGDQSRTLIFDIDDPKHTPEAEVSGWDPETGAICQALQKLGIPKTHIGVEYSGRKGYHVWVVLSKKVEAAKLRRLGRAVLGLAKVKCEVFPKQDSARDLGNLVKLPEGKHQVTGNSNNWKLGPPQILQARTLDSIVLNLPEEPKKSTFVGEGDSPYPCMTHIQEGIEEGGRNNGLFHLAVMLRRQGLTPENVTLVVHAANANCNPPLPDEEVDILLESSATSGPLCNSIPEEMGCGNLCIFKRTPGLKVRPGALRHVREGEGVVVLLTEREGKRVDISHPDILSGVATLKGTEETK